MRTRPSASLSACRATSILGCLPLISLLAGCATLMDRANEATVTWQLGNDCPTAIRIAGEVIHDPGSSDDPDALRAARWVRGECTFASAVGEADLARAEADLRAVIAVDPEAVVARATLAKAQRALGKSAECATTLEPPTHTPCPTACESFGDATEDCILRCMTRRALRAVCLLEAETADETTGDEMAAAVEPFRPNRRRLSFGASQRVATRSQSGCARRASGSPR